MTSEKLLTISDRRVLAAVYYLRNMVAVQPNGLQLPARVTF